MPQRLFWSRLVAAAVLAAGLTLLALRIAPGTTVGVQLRMMLFVLVVPWAIALIVVPPARLAGAFAAAWLGRPGEGLVTLRALEFLGGLTIVTGAIGAFGSHTKFLETATRTEAWGNLTREDVPGAVAALILAPAFALIVRLAIFEPVVWSLRRRLPPEHAAAARPRGRWSAWKVVLIVVATVLAVEGFHAFLLGPLWKVEEPVPDTAIAVARLEAESTDTVAIKPIRIQLLRGEASTECRVNGEPLLAGPGRTDEVRERILHLREDGRHGRLEIEVAPEVPYRYLIAAASSCIEARTARPGLPGSSGGSGISLLVPSERPFALQPCLRLVHDEHPYDRELVLLQLPASDVSEPFVPTEDQLPPINICYYARDRVAAIRWTRTEVTVDEVEALLYPIVRSRVDDHTSAAAIPVRIRCDTDAPCATLLSVLARLAGENLRVSSVQLEVFRYDR